MRNLHGPLRTTGCLCLFWLATMMSSLLAAAVVDWDQLYRSVSNPSYFEKLDEKLHAASPIEPSSLTAGARGLHNAGLVLLDLTDRCVNARNSTQMERLISHAWDFANFFEAADDRSGQGKYINFLFSLLSTALSSIPLHPDWEPVDQFFWADRIIRSILKYPQVEISNLQSLAYFLQTSIHPGLTEPVHKQFVAELILVHRTLLSILEEDFLANFMLSSEMTTFTEWSTHFFEKEGNEEKAQAWRIYNQYVSTFSISAEVDPNFNRDAIDLIFRLGRYSLLLKLAEARLADPSMLLSTHAIERARWSILRARAQIKMGHHSVAYSQLEKFWLGPRHLEESKEIRFQILFYLAKADKSRREPRTKPEVLGGRYKYLLQLMKEGIPESQIRLTQSDVLEVLNGVVLYTKPSNEKDYRDLISELKSKSEVTAYRAPGCSSVVLGYGVDLASWRTWFKSLPVD